MNTEQSKQLSKILNKIGMLVYTEVNGIQHRFKLSIKELSPNSVIFQQNKKFIEDTQHTLIPIGIAGSIHYIGKKLFDPSYYHLTKSDFILTKYDYIKTHFGRLVAEDSFDKMYNCCDRLQRAMRERADEKVQKEYEKYYKGAFVFAYNFFSAKMKEFREQLEILNGSMNLFWKEVEKINNDLKGIEEIFKKKYPDKKISISDLTKPDVKTAFKLRLIPQTYKEYREQLGYSFIYTGFHPNSFLDYKWKEDYWRIKDLPTARDILFESNQSKPMPLFNEEKE